MLAGVLSYGFIYLKIFKKEVLIVKKIDEIRKELEEYKGDIERSIDEYNAALDENNFVKMSQAEAALKAAEDNYAETKEEEVFEALKAEENPVKAAIIEHSYNVVTHHANRKKGVIIGYELVTDRLRQIDLLKFCKYCDLPTAWQYKVEKFNQLLALRTANDLKLPKSKVKDICDSFYMNKLAREIDLGGTPDSNTQICKQLQMVVDAIIYEDNGKGKNLYRALSRDVTYLLLTYTKRNNKKVCSVQVAKNSYMHKLILDVIHRILTGGVYDLDYQIVKNPVKTESVKTTEEKPKTEVKPEPEKVEVEADNNAA